MNPDGEMINTRYALCETPNVLHTLSDKSDAMGILKFSPNSFIQARDAYLLSVDTAITLLFNASNPDILSFNVFKC